MLTPLREMWCHGLLGACIAVSLVVEFVLAVVLAVWMTYVVLQ